MAKSSNISSTGSSAPLPSTSSSSGVNLLPKLQVGQSAVGANMANSNSLGGKIGNIFGNLKASYNQNPELYNQVIGMLGSTAAGIAAYPENLKKQQDLIHASYYKNPYLMNALGQPTDYSTYYSDLLDKLYLAKIASEAKKKKLVENLENDTEQWYQNNSNRQNNVTSGGSGIIGLDASEGTIV